MFEAEMGENPFGRLDAARVAGDDGGTMVVGYVCFWIVFEEFRLMNLAVSRSARRQGIGQTLLNHALSIGQQHGASRALLEVRRSNRAALTLYERTGFCRTAVREQYYTNPVEDAVLMELDPLAESTANRE
jgi:ribosomal-protein-alanine N-acetyltransferase